MSILSHVLTMGKLEEGKRGQSLVEIAITAPLLLLMLLGVFEVGWVLRSYMVLSTVNRETTRFAVKQGQLDFSQKDPNTIGYDKVFTHALESVAGQLPLDFTQATSNATMILSYFVVDTGFPCVEHDSNGKPMLTTDNPPRYKFDTDCVCSAGADDPQWFTRDDLILHPDLPGYSHYARTYGIITDTNLSSTGTYTPQAKALALANNQLNCAFLQGSSPNDIQDLAENADKVFVSELMYDSPQLLGAPIISNQFTDPVPLYTQTTMRVTLSRGSDASNTVGPVCELYPIIFDQAALSGSPPLTNTPVSLTEGANFQWVDSWNGSGEGEDYVAEALYNKRLSINDVSGRLQIGDSVSTATISNPPLNEVDWGLKEMEGKTVRLPVYDGSPDTIANLALIEISNVTVITNTPRVITGIFRGFDPQACE